MPTWSGIPTKHYAVAHDDAFCMEIVEVCEVKNLIVGNAE
jgi:hypothetical protein